MSQAPVGLPFFEICFHTDYFSFRRILGSLISTHILLTDTKHPFGKVGFEGYDNELLHLAHDLAVRLLPAFENTSTGIPYPRVRDTIV